MGRTTPRCGRFALGSLRGQESRRAGGNTNETGVPASGDTYANLQALVLGNSFGTGRYAEQAKAALNDGVTDVCRRLRIHRRKLRLIRE